MCARFKMSGIALLSMLLSKLTPSPYCDRSLTTPTGPTISPQRAPTPVAVGEYFAQAGCRRATGWADHSPYTDDAPRILFGQSDPTCGVSGREVCSGASNSIDGEN